MFGDITEVSDRFHTIEQSASPVIERSETMVEIKVSGGKTFCENCGNSVPVIERKRTENTQVATATLALVLIGDCGHLIAERAATNEPWEKYVE